MSLDLSREALQRASERAAHLFTEIYSGLEARRVDHAHRVAVGDRIFGCDDCQLVCPWNRFSKPHAEPLFDPHPDLLHLTRADWEEITQEVFRDLFPKSAVKRTGYHGLIRNIDFAAGSDNETPQ